MPYLTIHMQSIGLTIEEIALTYLALPFTTFLAPPVTGFLVDKFGRYKPIVLISFFLNAAIHHSLMLIPHQETPGIMPPGFVMKGPEDIVEVWWSPCPSRKCPEPPMVDIVLDNCVDYCKLKKNKKKIKKRKTINEVLIPIYKEYSAHHDNSTLRYVKYLTQKKKKFIFMKIISI